MSETRAPLVVGIDFGTSNSRVAALIDGEPVILEDGQGVRTMPADVLLRTDGSVAVGKAARRLGPEDDALIIHAAKRLLGRAWDDPLLDAIKADLGGRLIRSGGGSPLIVLQDTRFRPADICRLLFEKMRETACTALKRDVREAVLAVPADYGAAQRHVLREIASQAGWVITRLVSEPTAAALFHGPTRRSPSDRERRIAVYDLGGGTFDISILEVGDGVFRVLSSFGDAFLGGEDIDTRLLTHILGLSGVAADELTATSMSILRCAVERLKIELSDHDTAQLIEPRLPTKKGGQISIAQTVSRETLQDLSQALIDRTLLICDHALQASAAHQPGQEPLQAKDIDDICLVGGTTRLPFIEDCISRYFGRPLAPGLRREDAVALGCALYGGMLTGALDEPLLLDVTSTAYGLQVEQDQPISLIVRNTSFPCRSERFVRSGTSSEGEWRVQVFEGAPGSASSGAIVSEIACTPTADEKGQTAIELTLIINASGELDLLVRDLMSRTSRTERLTPVGDRTVHAATIRPYEAICETPLAAPRPPARMRKILAVATEWSSGAGGLSTFNREFCLALSAIGHDVKCLVLAADAQERRAAMEGGVELIEAARIPGLSEQVGLARKPDFGAPWQPDLVIGHGRVTGPAAAAQVIDHWPQAERMHLIHMAADEIEWFKLDRGDDRGSAAEERTGIERALGETARHIVAVGPRLHNRYLTEFVGAKPAPLRLDPGFDNRGVTSMEPPPGAPWRILLVGRAEDETLKGLDIAAQALGALHKRGTLGSPFELVVRGAPLGESTDLQKKLISWSKVSNLNVVVRPFSRSAEDLKGDYRRASLVLMPSRREGFGLVGLEAICSGVPALISSESGLAELLQEILSVEEANRMVVSVVDDPKKDKLAWANAIERVLLHRHAAFRHAEKIRALLSEKASWARGISAMFAQMDNPGSSGAK